ncbi:hypothetical protein Bbelb_407090 [Branchiostoma belcheri]|nr:hypothetical protein Bbelb_407090 [Branchiostoma belcheri]
MKHMFIVGDRIGQTWMPWTMEQREADLLKGAVKRDCVKQFTDVLSAPISLQNVQVRNEPTEDEVNAGALFNKHEANEADLNDLDQCLDHSYNLFCLFLRESGNLTVWTVSKAIPYFARELHDVDDA